MPTTMTITTEIRTRERMKKRRKRTITTEIRTRESMKKRRKRTITTEIRTRERMKKRRKRAREKKRLTWRCRKRRKTITTTIAMSTRRRGKRSLCSVGGEQPGEKRQDSGTAEEGYQIKRKRQSGTRKTTDKKLALLGQTMRKKHRNKAL